MSTRFLFLCFPFESPVLCFGFQSTHNKNVYFFVLCRIAVQLSNFKQWNSVPFMYMPSGVPARHAIQNLNGPTMLRPAIPMGANLFTYQKQINERILSIFLDIVAVVVCWKSNQRVNSKVLYYLPCCTNCFTSFNVGRNASLMLTLSSLDVIYGNR